MIPCFRAGGRTRIIRRMSIIALACCVSWGGSLAATTSSARAAPFRYCATEHAVFTGKHRFLGVTAWVDIAPGSAHYRDCAYGLMAADHIGYVRSELDWVGVEPRPGFWDFSGYDRIVALLAAHHLQWLPILMDAPAFASIAPSASAFGLWPPRHPSQFAAFAALAVQRYGPHGTFWKDNPSLPYVPVHAWQIWNEPSLPYYWEPSPNPAAYTRLLIAASKAIKSVDRHAEIVTAGMPYD